MSDKTYSETQGVPAFDWWKALENPQNHSHWDLCALAQSWVTCACGNQCAIIPRDVHARYPGQPVDEGLSALGIRFHSLVEGACWERAKGVLAEIEARSEILITDELAKRNAGLRKENVTSDGALDAAAATQIIPEGAGERQGTNL